MKNVGIYVHIPFCKQKCKYCDFTSFSGINNRIDEYCSCLLTEIEEKSNNNKMKFKEGLEDLIQVDTVYIGGGTPSIVLEDYIENIISKIKECFTVIDNAEITIEINPGTVNEEKLKKYYNIGINRISLGLQSTNDELLKLLGRIHSYNDFLEVYETARNVVFNNINVDLMIGLPNQTIEDVEKSLDEIISKQPEHISVYSLIVEEGTKMYELIDNGIFVLPDEETERNMYWRVKDILSENGYIHYEISNFSKKTYESKHNLNCWNQHSYLGFGLAAHSYFNGARYSNVANLEKYIENCKNSKINDNVILHEKQGIEQMMKEYMLLGLRKIDGVDINEFKCKFVQNPLYVFRNELNKLICEMLVEVDNNKIRLTGKGLDLANLVWVEFT